MFNKYINVELVFLIIMRDLGTTGWQPATAASFAAIPRPVRVGKWHCPLLPVGVARTPPHSSAAWPSRTPKNLMMNKHMCLHGCFSKNIIYITYITYIPDQYLASALVGHLGGAVVEFIVSGSICCFIKSNYFSLHTLVPSRLVDRNPLPDPFFQVAC